MAFSALFIGVFIIKAVVLWMFYPRQGLRAMLLGAISCIAWYPLLTILYHETDINFWIMLLLMMAADVFMYNLFLRKSWVKSILLSVFLNLFAMIFFLFVNG